MEKKSFFRRPTVGQIKRNSLVTLEGRLPDMASQIASLASDQSFYLPKKLLGNEPAHRYKKRGPSIPLIAPRSRSYRYVAPSKSPLLVLESHPMQKPLDTLELMVKNLDRFDLTGYGWIGEGRDQRYRHVALVKVLAGARLFAYESKLGSPDVRVYEGKGHAVEQGLLAYTTVSSECKTAARHKVELRGIPITEHAHWKRLQSVHACQGKMWSEARYDHPLDPERIMFCKHEVAAYFTVAAHCAEQLSNKHPAQLSPFVPPSQLLVDFYKKLLRQGIVQDGEGVRLMHEGEMEQFLFAYVGNIGVRSAFRSNSSDPNYRLKDRDWS